MLQAEAMLRPLWILVVLLPCWACGSDLSSDGATPPNGSPSEWILWAWQRPEDVRFLADHGSANTSVAVWVATLRWSSKDRRVLGREHPLAMPKNMPMTAVVRLESSRANRPFYDQSELVWLRDQILAAAADKRFRAIQIDFDAVVSERDFYARLLRQLRRHLAQSQKLEITALAHWCLGDPWIRDLPIDQAIPMLFRMGPDDRGIRRRLSRGESMTVDLCQGAYGFSTDEPKVPAGAGSRVFLFHPEPWNRQAAIDATTSVTFY